MKRPLALYIFEILLLILLTTGALGVLVPVSSAMNRELALFRDSMIGRLEKETGLNVSYRSLSPSIFKSIEIRDLVIRDASDASVVASVSRASVSYDLFALIRGDLPGVLKEIVIENGSAVIDRALDAKLLDKLQAFTLVNSKEKIDPAKIRPLVVRLRNFDVSWRDSGIALSGTVSTGRLTIDTGSISVDLDSKVRLSSSAIGDQGPLSSRIRLEGSINRTFDTGTATLMLTSIQGKNFTLSRLGLVTSLRNGVVSVSSVQDLQPLDIKLAWDIKDERLSGSFNCDRLYPLEWLHLGDESGLSGDLRRSRISGSATVAWSRDAGMSWTLKMNASIPETLYGGADISLDCSGRDDFVDVHDASILGELYDISYAGSVSLAGGLPDGFLSVRKCILPGGTRISGDMYIERVKNRVTGIVPLLSVDDAYFSGVEISVANNGKAYDFALSAYDSTGHVSADGSWSGEDGNFLQFSAAFDSVSVSNGLGAALAFALPNASDLKRSLCSAAAPYLLTTEVYVSTNFTELSFNCNRLVVASAEKDGLYALFSIKGTQRGIDITDITFSHGGYDLSGNVYMGFDTSGDILFDSALKVNSLPYSLHGMYSNGTLSLYGDYGLAVSVLFDQMGGVSGSFMAKDLPVPVGPALLSLTFSAGFTYGAESDWKITMYSVSLEEMKGLLPLSSIIEASGTITPSGVFFDRLSLTDQYSKISGHGGISLVPGVSSEPRFTADISLANPETKESYSVKGQIRNATELYFEGEVSVVDSPLMRFIKGQAREDLVSFHVTCSGTPSNILASASIDKIVYQFGGFDLEARAKISLLDRVVTLYDAGGTWNGNVLSKMTGSLSLDTMQASVSASYNNVLGDSGMSSSVQASFVPGDLNPVEQLSGLQGFLDRFTVKAVFTGTKWKTAEIKEPFECSIVREKGITAFYAGKDDALSGFLLDDGTLSVQTVSGLPISFHANGSIVNSTIDVEINDFHADMPALWPWLGLDILSFSSGTVDGGISAKGLLYDPEFTGTLTANDIQLTAPGNLEGVYSAQPFSVSFADKTLRAEPFVVTGLKGSFMMDAAIVFDRWFPVDIALNAKTMPGDRVKVKMVNDLFRAEGSASCDLALSWTGADGLGISGSVLFEQGAFAIDFVNLTKPVEASKALQFPVNVNLNLSVGKKVEFRWPNNDIPIIRGLVQADEPLSISLNTTDNTYRFKGSANFRGGEILYVKRSFYLREGAISFNENQDSFNPMITLKAEVRERDANGEPVRVILSVKNQPLLSFTPVLSSDPPKSNLEILSLLGQAVVSDTSQSTLLRNTIVSASDIFTQFGLFRTVENSIRDVANLDIFSIRTLILQNALFGTAMQGESGKQMSFGNYFDNTTVYMGKYLGSAIYADALLHFSYYDPATATKSRSSSLIYGNLLFQPEFGTEITTPLFSLRWGITPSHPETLFIADHSITLSWKFSY